MKNFKFYVIFFLGLISFTLIFVFHKQIIQALAPEEQQPPQKQTRTTKFFILQNTGDLTAGSQIDQAFSVFIGEQSPVIKSAIIELRGVKVNPGASPSVTVSIDDISLVLRQQNYNFDADSGAKPFKIFYDATSYMASQITGPGAWNFTLSMKANNVTLSALSARISLTYEFTPPSAGTGYYPYADLVSTTFDTGSDGAAYNSIMWKGTLGGPSQNQGKVKFQFATSNNSSGPWDFIGGSTCTGVDWYDTGVPPTGGSDKPVELSGTNCVSQFNNKRYFRYKIRICSANDCSANGDYTPTVDDVVVSWSP